MIHHRRILRLLAHTVVSPAIAHNISGILKAASFATFRRPQSDKYKLSRRRQLASENPVLHLKPGSRTGRSCEFKFEYLTKKRAIQASHTEHSAQATKNKDDDWGIYNFKATLVYKGTAYKGWQLQNGKSAAPTIQQKVERALSEVKQENRRVLRIQGAGRTDAGVHARGQVFNFYSNKLTPPLGKLVLGVNSNLPKDIRVTSIQRVPPDFSARYSALSKVYSFHLQTGQVADPFREGLAQYSFRTLDVDAMRRAAEEFIGTHDFTQFSSIPSAERPVSPVKRITAVEVTETLDGLSILMDGSGFLYNQCRHMAGCLIQVGLGKLSWKDVARLLEMGAKEPAGRNYRGWPLAAAEGLYLEEVRYPHIGDYTKLLYPDLPHDSYGRVWLENLPQGLEKQIIARMKNMRPAI